MKAKVILISYGNSLGCDLKEMYSILRKHFKGIIGGVHLLPFFPSSADRGFAPMDYHEVSPELGTWEDVEAISRDYELMADFMINHLSAHSKEYLDFLARKDESPYRELFIRYPHFWADGHPTRDELAVIYKRKERDPYVEARFADGSTEKVWCTFDAEQIDLNCESETGKRFIRDQLLYLAEKGVAGIRLDAFAYAVKRPGGSCFFEEPGVWELLDQCQDLLSPYGVEILPEIHEHYTIQQKIAAHGYPVYDFALPMLLLHALYFGETKYLKHWLTICPRNQFTTLDTHDGIGVVDVKDLLPDEEIQKTKDHLYRYGANVKPNYNTAEYNNLDVYQINCTYYSALGENDACYLLARAVQVFTPGRPMIYYVGLLAGRNDTELIEKTKVGRDINRHAYTIEEAENEIQRPVVRKLCRLLRFRNECKAFDGKLQIIPTKEEELMLSWQNEDEAAMLKANLKTHAFTVLHQVGESIETILDE